MWSFQKGCIKKNRERWRHHFRHYKSIGAFCCHGNQFWSNLPKHLMQPFLHPNDATHKIWSRLANWLQRYSSSNVWNFRHSRASNSKMSGLIRPKIEFDQAFMPVLVTSNFHDDSIKNERASIETPLYHYKSMGNFLDAQGQLTPYSVVLSGPNSNSSEIVCIYSLPPSIKRIWSKATKERWRHHFPHYKSMGAFCCHGDQSSDPICCLSPLPVTLHIKFDRLANWPQRYSSSKV